MTYDDLASRYGDTQLKQIDPGQFVGTTKEDGKYTTFEVMTDALLGSTSIMSDITLVTSVTVNGVQIFKRGAVNETRTTKVL